MENQKIIDGNRKIAEFMGWRRAYNKTDWIHDDWKDHNTHTEMSEGIFRNYRSWDWLMKVIDKIEAMGYDTRICNVASATGGVRERQFLAEIETQSGNELVYIIDKTSKIETVWECVIEFIDKLKERGE